jgi:hypothetical protein
MFVRRAASLILLTCVVLSGCKRKPATPPDVISRVNERMLTLADFKRYLDRNAGTDLAQLTPEVASAMLDQYVEEIIVSEYAASKCRPRRSPRRCARRPGLRSSRNATR